MITIEFEGKNVDIAKEKASDSLNIPKSKVNFDIISYGSTGIFGLVGSKKAKIRVKLPDENKKIAKDLADEIFNNENKVFIEINDNQDGEKACQEYIETGKEALNKILNAITENFQINVIDETDILKFKIIGGNTSMIIGKKGKNLDAIQYIVEKIINKKNKKRIKIIIDVEKYLEKRIEKLKLLSNRYADRTKKAGKTSTISNLNSYERKIIHMNLKGNNFVKTKSIGTGENRKVLIYPKNTR